MEDSQAFARSPSGVFDAISSMSSTRVPTSIVVKREVISFPRHD